MLYKIQKEYEINPEEIVYLVCAVNQLGQNEFYFSDGHLNNKLSKLYDKIQMQKLLNILDWGAIKAKYWNSNNDDTDIKRKKEAEFLVKNDISPSEYYYFRLL